MTLDRPLTWRGGALYVPAPRSDPRDPAPVPAVRTDPAPPADAVSAALALDGFARLSLDEVLAAAALQTRVDRKYLVPIPAARQALAGLAHSHGVLSIDGRTTTGYSSVYFDSVDWGAFRAHAQGRRRRWKIRTRLYREDRLCRLELKTKQGDTTVKQCLDLPAASHGLIDEAGYDFLQAGLQAYGSTVDVERLLPGVVITYRRATLTDVAAGTRLTVDADLVACLDGRAVRLRPDHVLIETKGGAAPGAADGALRESGVRPCSVSKYSVTLALLDPTLPGHLWRPFGRRYFAPLAAETT